MGATVARRLASEGANLMMTDISGRRLEEVAEGLRTEFPAVRIVTHRASVISEEEVKGLLEATSAAFPTINVLVNVVGGVKGGLAVSLENMTNERWTGTFDLNLNGIRYLVRGIAPGMRDRRYGRIVNFASMAYAGDPEMPEYGAAKAAVAALTRAIAYEFAPHITANCVAPGPIQTTVMDRIDPKWIEAHLARTPLKRLGKAEDVAAAVAFLASDDASYITGSILPVAGGIWPAL
jgi:NAD(P)-dependent dehydrogenase (short-subunit alcohol dehydrogenase family)